MANKKKKTITADQKMLKILEEKLSYHEMRQLFWLVQKDTSSKFHVAMDAYGAEHFPEMYHYERLLPMSIKYDY